MGRNLREGNNTWKNQFLSLWLQDWEVDMVD